MHLEHLDVGVLHGTEDLARLFHAAFTPKLRRLSLRRDVRSAEASVQQLAEARPELMIEWEQHVYNPRPTEDPVPIAGPVLEPPPRGAPPLGPLPLQGTAPRLAPVTRAPVAPHRTHPVVLVLGLMLFSVSMAE